MTYFVGQRVQVAVARQWSAADVGDTFTVTKVGRKFLYLGGPYKLKLLVGAPLGYPTAFSDEAASAPAMVKMYELERVSVGAGPLESVGYFVSC